MFCADQRYYWPVPNQDSCPGITVSAGGCQLSSGRHVSVAECYRLGLRYAGLMPAYNMAPPQTPPPAALPTASAPTQPVTLAAPQPSTLVASIQTLLGALGFDVGEADGLIGPKTLTAISAFQASVGDVPDGRPSESLRTKLQRAIAERGQGANASARPSELRTKPVSAGTGFYIGPDIIITNHHVIDGCIEVRANKYGAELGSVITIATSSADDLAALRSAKPTDRYLKLRVGVPIRAAESILVFGYPLTGALSSSGNTTLGHVTALTGLRDDSRYIQISAAIQPGNSGGPVIDEVGRLVGVVESKLNALKMAKLTGDIPQNVNFAVRSSTLANFLEANRIPYEPAKEGASLPNTQLAERAEAASVQLECRK